MGMRFFVFLLGVGLVGCVARSHPRERYYQSVDVGAPAHTVSLVDPQNFSFSLVGDLHIAHAHVDAMERIVDQSIAAGDAFSLFLGDIVDTGEESDFLAYQQLLVNKGWNGKAFPVLGNHDVFYNGWQHYRTHLGPNHYAVEMGNAKFVIFDTADGLVGEDQMRWLEAELAKPRPTHLFLASHYMPLVPGITTYLKLASQEEANQIMKWAKTYRVTAWFGAHYHSYLAEKIEDTWYLVAGGAGGRRMDPIRENFYVQAQIAGEDVSFHLRAFNESAPNR